MLNVEMEMSQDGDADQKLKREFHAISLLLGLVDIIPSSQRNSLVLALQ